MNMYANKKTTLRSVVRPMITAIGKRLATRWSAVSLAMMASLGFHDDEPETEPRPSVPINENDEAGDASDAADNVVDAESTLDFAAFAAIVPAPSATLTRVWMMRPPSSTPLPGRRLEAIDETASVAVDDAEDARMLARCVTQRVHCGVECFDIDDEEDDDEEDDGEPEVDDEQERQEADAVDEEEAHEHEIRAAADDSELAPQAAAEDGTTLDLLRSDVVHENDNNHAPATLAPVATVAATGRASLDRLVDVQDEQDDATEDAIDGFEPVLPSDDDSAFPVELLHDDEHASIDTPTAADAVTDADAAHAPLHQPQTTSEGTGAMAAVAVDDDDDAGASPSPSSPPRPLNQPSGSASSRSTASLSSSRSTTTPSLSSVSADARMTRMHKVSPYAHVTAKVQSHNHTSAPPPPRDYATKEAAATKLLRVHNRVLRQRLATVGPRVGSFNYGPPPRKPTPTDFEQTLAFEQLEVRLENHAMRRRLSHVVATVRTQATSSESSQSPSASSFPSDIVSLPASTSTSTSSRAAQRRLEQATVRRENAAARQRRSLVQAVVQSHNQGPHAARPSSRSSTSTRTTARSTPSLRDPVIQAASAAQRERLRCVRPVTNSHNATATR